ncbi:MAG: hypothetical protein QM640_09830 [Niabella sp.]
MNTINETGIYEIVSDLVEHNGCLTGYITNSAIFYQLGLTDVLNHSIEIGTNERRRQIKRAGYIISFIPQKNTITRDNIELLLARKYPASTRVILAILLEAVFEYRLSEKLKATVNPKLTYDIPFAIRFL